MQEQSTPRDLLCYASLMNEDISMITVVYMAHPVGGDVKNNLAEARLWVRHLEETNPDIAISASWITECEIWDDTDPVQRAAGMRRNMAILAKCDELWAVGPRVSKGMLQEMIFATSKGIKVSDMTGASRDSSARAIGR